MVIRLDNMEKIMGILHYNKPACYGGDECMRKKFTYGKGQEVMMEIMADHLPSGDLT